MGETCWYKPEEVAEHWGLSTCFVRQLVREGELKGMKIGKIVRISGDAIREFENDHMYTGHIEPIAPKRQLVTRI